MALTSCHIKVSTVSSLENTTTSIKLEQKNIWNKMYIVCCNMNVPFCIHTVLLVKVAAFNTGVIYKVWHQSQSAFSQMLKCKFPESYGWNNIYNGFLSMSLELF